MLDKTLYSVQEIVGWDEFLDTCKIIWKNGLRMIFRGQKSDKWSLQTTFERSIYNIDNQIFEMRKNALGSDEKFEEIQRRVLREGLNGNSVIDFEKLIIRRFKRICSSFMERIPHTEKHVEWLVVMQHHGVPTRLLEWTYSPFIALFFAIELADDDCVVWAIDADRLDTTVRSILSGEDSNYLEIVENREKLFMELISREEPQTLVYIINPFTLPKQLILQQSVFLCPGNLNKPFEDNLTENLFEPNTRDMVKKYIIRYTPLIKKEILQNLHGMNINKATLFPDFNGFSQSLNSLIGIHWYT
jgi:hypothetical protein